MEVDPSTDPVRKVPSPLPSSPPPISNPKNISKASFDHLREGYETDPHTLNGRHAEVQSDKTHNESLWQSIKKSANFFKGIFKITEKIDRNHDDFPDSLKPLQIPIQNIPIPVYFL